MIMQKKILFIALLLMSFHSYSQGLKNKLNQIKGGGLSQEEAGMGLKEALSKGVETGVAIVTKQDGYFGNPKIKIPFPPEAQAVESKLRSIGMNKEVDDVVLSINRAAEDAAKEAKPIFVDAIRALTFQDAINLIRGDQDAATRFLERTTSASLTAKFKPIISASLDKVSATKHWETVTTAYNKIPLVKRVNPNLEDYVTERALIGLFFMVEQEEVKIRKDPAARTSDILRKAFGG
jgi:hypothetical protein